MSEHASTRSRAASEGATRPAWLPFWIILGTVLVLLSGPYVLDAVAPPVVAGKVGVYERIRLSTQTDSGSAIGGFVAPEGWIAIEDQAVDGDADDVEDADADADDADETDHTNPSEQSFIAPDQQSSITVALRTGVETPEQVLRESSPVGAALVPVSQVPEVYGLELALVNYDLQAGNGRTQLLAACGTFRTTNCLLITSVMNARYSDPRPASSSEDPILLPEVRSMLESIEVFG